jgi:hypothetical protein
MQIALGNCHFPIDNCLLSLRFRCRTNYCRSRYGGLGSRGLEGCRCHAANMAMYSVWIQHWSAEQWIGSYSKPRHYLPVSPGIRQTFHTLRGIKPVLREDQGPH